MQLPEFALERYFSRHEFNTPYLMCCSDAQTMSVGELLALEPEGRETFLDLGLGYTEAPGGAELRREIAASYQGTSPEEILVFSGAEEAIFVFMNVFLKPGDHLVVPRPCYQSLFQVAAGLGARVSPWFLREEEGWEMNIATLEAALEQETRVVILNSPHNPTGSVIAPRAFDDLVTLARERGFMVFSDEVYRHLEPEALRSPSFHEVDSRAASLGVMSKSFGLAGLRLGWIATHDADLLAAMAAFKDYTTICNSGPSEFLATLALRHKERIIGRNRAIIGHNLTLADEFFDRHRDRFRWTPPLGGPVAFPSLPAGPADQFCAQVLERTGVLLLPGRVYGPGYASHFRVGLGRTNLADCLTRLDQYLGNW